MRYYCENQEEVLAKLNSSEAGLTEAEAQARLAKYGPNKLKEGEKPTLLQRFLAQLKDPMLIILLIAAGVSALTGMLAGETPDAAFYVDIGTNTMSRDDIMNGRLICEIGIAPSRPAEFVIFRVTQFTAEAGGAE